MYSVHNDTQMPERTYVRFKGQSQHIVNDLFNCSVPYYASFQDHIRCNLENDCIDGRDEADCPYVSPGCSRPLIGIGSKVHGAMVVRILQWNLIKLKHE